MGEPLARNDTAMQFEPLGDQAVLVTCAHEESAQSLASAISAATNEGLREVVVAYKCVALYYDLERTDYASVCRLVQKLALRPCSAPGRLFRIPCCYELGPDLAAIAEMCRCSVAEVIAEHSSTIYTVYALGFVPGFPYLGYLPPRLAGIPRLPQPRRQVAPGSVGLAGRQTGIYPAAVPGGWRILGRTPLIIADLATEFFPLRIGDRVEFVPIDRQEFDRLLGQRLTPCT
ncbi:MAG: carboxyltransferase domain-containing protein [Gemmatales bacterium]|nr:carboxyltransferase domain-containing protein [Gemmatales bacterium]